MYCIFLLKVLGSQRFRQAFRHLSKSLVKTIRNNWHVRTLSQSPLGCSVLSKGTDISLLVKQVLLKAVHTLRLGVVGRRLKDLIDSKECINSYHLLELKRHQKEINRVISYWFGQNTPDKSQKYLWMIASSSEEHRRKVDADISNKFGRLLIELSEETRHIWCSDIHDVFGWQGKVAAVIVLDQMSRHIHRHHVTTGKLNNTIPCQNLLDEYALSIAETIQKDHGNDAVNGLIPTPMLIFALMPLRHASTLQSVGYVQEKVKDISSFHSSDIENMIRRFRQATNRRMTLLQDEARREGRQTQYDPNEEKTNGIVQANASASDFSDDIILEFHPFETDMSNACNHPVVKTMIDFLAKRGVRSSKEQKGKHCEKESNDSNRTGKEVPLIISLSGGVDSMVIANVLAYLRDHCGFELYIIAVHIDYGNRPESSAEVRVRGCK